MNKQILQVKQTFERNVYKTRTYNIPFENILLYIEKTTDNDTEYVVVVKECGPINVSKEEYDEVVNYFNSQEKESESSIESTAFKIIKEKDVSPIDIRCCATVEQYNAKENGNIPLTQDEFDTLVHALKK